MNVKEKIKMVLKNPSWIIIKLASKNIIHMTDKKYLELQYKLIMGKELNLDNPKTFNEKIQWLKLYNRRQEYIKMVDKYEAKEYVSNIIGKEYVIPTIGIFSKFEDIDFEKLPNQFVMKCTHDSSSTIICDDKSSFNINKTKKKINKKLKTNFYFPGREWIYKNIKPRIIVEKNMTTEGQKDLMDYKYFCFNGKVRVILVCSNRTKKLKETWFDSKWNLLDLKEGNCEIDRNIAKPINLNLMIELSEKLAKNVPFLRVDWYEIDGKIYFGELTFYPNSGREKFDPPKYNKILGDMIKLPNKRREE